MQPQGYPQIGISFESISVYWKMGAYRNVALGLVPVIANVNVTGQVRVRHAVRLRLIKVGG